jgi:putative ABC transport system permease protein
MDPARESSVVEELAQHLEDRYAELLARGEPESEARRIALEEIEDAEGLLAATRLRRSSGLGGAPGTGRWVGLLAEDVRVALRTLLRTPGYTILAVLALALGIGANVAIFSILDAVLLNPLGFRDADRLVSIRGSAPGSDLPPEFGLGPEFFLEYRENASTLEDVGFYATGQASVRSGDHVERLYLATAAPSMFSTLGATPVIGRLPTEQDEKGSVALISHWLWTTWFARDSTVIGRSLDAGGGFRTVIGVMPPEFRFPEEQTAVWISDVVTEPVRAGTWGYRLVGRMAPGADHRSVAAELSQLVRRLPERFGGDAEFARLIEQHRPIVRSLEGELVGDLDRPLWIVQGAVALVLLIACANVANLLIVRAETRRHDLAVRRALGAGRADLIRSQMTEAFILVIVAAGAGVLLARFAVPLLVRAAPEGITGLASVRLDRGALAFAAIVTVVTGCAAGLFPALRFSNPEIGMRLRERQSAIWGSAKLMRNALVAVQTAAALVLTVGSGLLYQSFRALYAVDPGFETADVFTFQTAPDASDHGLTSGQAIARFHHDFMDRLAAIEGVESVGLVSTLPLDEGASGARVRTLRSGDPGTRVRMTMAGGDYFQTMGIDLLSGRYVERDASPGAEPQAIVSKSAAQLLWPGENPLGQALTLPRSDRDTDWLTVGGVVEDVMLMDFREGRPEPLIYLPLPGPTPRSWDGVTPTTPAYVVKTRRAETIGPEIRALIRQVAPDAPMYRIFTMDELAARSMARLSFTLLALAIGSVLSLVMGAIGIYATLAFVVAQRTKEIGIRIALGAKRSDVQRMVVGQGMKVVAIAVALGLAAAFAGRRLISSLLYGVSPNDLATYGVVVGLLVGVALLACWIPARRASRFDPTVALRAD